MRWLSFLEQKPVIYLAQTSLLPPPSKTTETVSQQRWHYLAAQQVVVGILQTAVVEAVADDRLWQAFQEEQQGLCYRVVAANWSKDG